MAFAEPYVAVVAAKFVLAKGEVAQFDLGGFFPSC